MKKHNNAGFSAILLIVLIALIGGGAYYAGTLKSKPITTDVVVNTSTSTVEVINTSIKAPSSEKVEIPSDKKVYASNIYNVSFELPKDLYVHEKLAFSSYVFSLLKTETRPKERTESCDCDSDVYGSEIGITSTDTYNTRAEAEAKESRGLLYYSGITQQMLNELNAKRTSSFPTEAFEKAKKTGVTIGYTFLDNNVNGLKVIKHIEWSEMNSEKIYVVYYVYANNKLYGISDGDSYSVAGDARLKAIATSFKSTK